MEGVWSLGAAVAYIAGYTLLQTGAQSWKWILASPAIFAVIGLLLRASAPESPMWLAARDAGELQLVSFGTLFDSAYRGKLAFISAMWLLQVVPLFAIYTYAPTVLAALGLGSSGSPAGSIASAGAGDPSASADSRSRCWRSAFCRLREPQSSSSHFSPTRSAWVRQRCSNSSIRPSFSPPRSARREPDSQQG
jgi:MFS family permease